MEEEINLLNDVTAIHETTTDQFKFLETPPSNLEHREHMARQQPRPATRIFQATLCYFNFKSNNKIAQISIYGGEEY